MEIKHTYKKKKIGNKTVGSRGPRKDTTSCDYHYKSILNPRRGFA